MWFERWVHEAPCGGEDDDDERDCEDGRDSEEPPHPPRRLRLPLHMLIGGEEAEIEREREEHEPAESEERQPVPAPLHVVPSERRKETRRSLRASTRLNLLSLTSYKTPPMAGPTLILKCEDRANTLSPTPRQDKYRYTNENFTNNVCKQGILYV